LVEVQGNSYWLFIGWKMPKETAAATKTSSPQVFIQLGGTSRQPVYFSETLWDRGTQVGWVSRGIPSLWTLAAGPQKSGGD